MSFGYSISDIVLVGQLAWSTYQKCLSASGEYRELSNEAISLHTAIKGLEREAEDADSLFNREGSNRGEDLLLIINNCTDVLKDLDGLIDKYQSLSQTQRFFKKLSDRLRFGHENLGDLRSKLTTHTSTITIFLQNLEACALARIETKIDKIAADARTGKRERSVVDSICTSDASEEHWDRFRKELIDEGISGREVHRFKDEIKVYVDGLVKQKAFDEVQPESRQFEEDELRIPEYRPTLSVNDEVDGVSLSSIVPGGSATYLHEWPTGEGKDSTNRPWIPPSGPTIIAVDEPDLHHELHERAIAYPPGSHTKFIPRDELDRLITADRIEAELKKTNLSDTEKSLCNQNTFINGRKVFAVLVCVRKPEWLYQLFKEGLIDDHLPLAVHETSMISDSSNHEFRGKIFMSFKGWSTYERLEFDRLQWLVLAPFFEYAGEHKELHDNCVLPITSQDVNIISSGQSSVYKVRIHPAHMSSNFYKSAEEEYPMLALKVPYPSKDQIAEQETAMLNALRKLDHPHIIKLLGTYSLQRRYHMIFPYAKSNLRQLWESNVTPTFSRENLLWTLRQIRGLAEGLSRIHVFELSSDTETDLPSPIGRTYLHPDDALNPLSAMTRQDGLFGRHGDLKPENILLFEAVDGHSSVAGGYGILQIADFGLGKLDRRHSRSRSNVGSNSGGTGTYQSPEALMDNLISRAYDIWSFGCICIEFIVWLLHGLKAVEEFAEMRLNSSSAPLFNDSFFSITIDSLSKPLAETRSVVIEMFQKLRDDSRTMGALHDLLNLIERDMLNVEYTTARGRITAIPLVARLTEILEKAEVNNGDNDYAFPKTLVLLPLITISLSDGRVINQHVI